MIDFIEHSFDGIGGLHMISTRRSGGVSDAPYTSLNLGHHVGDASNNVQSNRDQLSAQFGWSNDPIWLNQVHGTKIIGAEESATSNFVADGIHCQTIDRPCAILTADCLPLVLARADNHHFVCLHAGWKGIAAGVIEAGVKSLGGAAKDIRAWAGPCIGPQAFEVGIDVKTQLGGPSQVWISHPEDEKWFLDMYAYTQYRLENLGVSDFSYADACTFNEPEHYFSYRRDGVTGRQATVVWRST